MLMSFCFVTEIIVGAPYENDGSGAVYVYNGWYTYEDLQIDVVFDKELDVIVLPYTQRIAASDLDTGLRGFGFALSKAYDVDGNGFPGTIYPFDAVNTVK